MSFCHFAVRFSPDTENDVGRTLAEGYLQHRLVHQIVRYYEMQWHAFHWQERENERPARYGVGSPRVSMHRVKDTHKVHKDLQRANQITTSHKLSLGRMHTCWFSCAYELRTKMFMSWRCLFDNFDADVWMPWKTRSLVFHWYRCALMNSCCSLLFNIALESFAPAETRNLVHLISLRHAPASSTLERH